MSNDAMETEELDWRTRCRAESATCEFSIVVALNNGECQDESLNQDQLKLKYAALADELAHACGADTCRAEGLDVGVGFSWEAIGFVVGLASGIAGLWSTALQVAPKIRAAIRHLQSEYGTLDRQPMLILSIEALKYLVVDDIRTKAGLDPTLITSVQHIVHAPDLPERRSELREMYSAYTITVEAKDDRFLHIWNYFLTSDGNVVSSSQTRVPCPNASTWNDVSLPSNMLVSETSENVLPETESVKA